MIKNQKQYSKNCKELINILFLGLFKIENNTNISNNNYINNNNINRTYTYNIGDYNEELTINFGARFKHKKTRKTVYQLLVQLINYSNDYLNQISELFLKKLKIIKPPNSWNYSLKYELKKKTTDYLGLKNLGSTCFLNSLIQQFFMIPKLRKRIVNLNIEPNNENIVYQLQLLFAHLLEDEKKYIDTRNFCKTFKDFNNKPLNVSKQMDVYEFLTMFWSHINNYNEPKELFKKYFEGKFLNEINESKSNQIISQKVENFFVISLEVKNKLKLQDSLDQYFQSEFLTGENQFYSEQLKKKVDAIKKTYVSSLPNYLILHLKRFEWDYNLMKRFKINTKFKFPQKLNFSKYFKLNTVNNQDYNLNGIIVHWGTSESGHYYSLIKDDNGGVNNDKDYDVEKDTGFKEKKIRQRWYRFDDTNVSEFNPKKIPEECYGGNDQINNTLEKNFVEKNYSAYMLIYKKNESLDNKHDPKLSRSITQQTPNKNQIINQIWKNNSIFLFNKYFYEKQFFQFLNNFIESNKNVHYNDKGSNNNNNNNNNGSSSSSSSSIVYNNKDKYNNIGSNNSNGNNYKNKFLNSLEIIELVLIYYFKKYNNKNNNFNQKDVLEYYGINKLLNFNFFKKIFIEKINPKSLDNDHDHDNNNNDNDNDNNDNDNGIGNDNNNKIDNELIISIFNDWVLLILNFIKNHYKKHYLPNNQIHNISNNNKNDQKVYNNEIVISILINLTNLIQNETKYTKDKFNEIFINNFNEIWSTFLFLDNQNNNYLDNNLINYLIFLKRGIKLNLKKNTKLITSDKLKIQNLDEIKIGLKKEFLLFNEQKITLYFKIINYCLNNSYDYQQYIGNSNTFFWCIKNFILRSNNYPKITKMFLKILKTNLLNFQKLRKKMLSYILRDDTYFLNSPTNLITILNLLLIDKEDQIGFCAFNGFNKLSKFLLFKLNLISNKKNSQNKNIMKNNTKNSNRNKKKPNKNHKHNNSNNNNNIINKGDNSNSGSSSNKNISRSRSRSTNSNKNSNNNNNTNNSNQNEDLNIIESSIIILEKGLNWIDFSKNQKNIKKIAQLWGERKLLIDTFKIKSQTQTLETIQQLSKDLVQTNIVEDDLITIAKRFATLENKTILCTEYMLKGMHDNHKKRTKMLDKVIKMTEKVKFMNMKNDLQEIIGLFPKEEEL
ncbi:ubiquitin carboxyl-terminal hydrolase [Anaeramoeba flamelloides]|uniref:Ubiquitin carboxyl-terminal hydrolase n=1 Tax=Anaeramoeba flamelloides TaxID=1746091 RepID=A0ABQ8ZFI4_9EUKA|nr:ubiquitin carboxyl-terminal hydrolase [Anaeramoeba flamelloides]